MAQKKDELLKGGLNALFNGSKPEGAPVEREPKKAEGKTEPTEETTKEASTRVCFVCNPTKWEKVKLIAEQKELSIKDVMDVAISTLIEKYEEINGEVKPKTRRPRGNKSDLFK